MGTQYLRRNEQLQANSHSQRRFMIYSFYFHNHKGSYIHILNQSRSSTGLQNIEEFYEAFPITHEAIKMKKNKYALVIDLPLFRAEKKSNLALDSRL